MKDWVVVKRNGAREGFSVGKISLAVFRACEAHGDWPASRSREISHKIAAAVGERLKQDQSRGAGKVVDLEEVQDAIVQCLLAIGEEQLAHKYNAYRSERAEARQASQEARIKSLSSEANKRGLPWKAWESHLKAIGAEGGEQRFVDEMLADLVSPLLACADPEEFYSIQIEWLTAKSNGLSTRLWCAAKLFMEQWVWESFDFHPVEIGQGQTEAKLKEMFAAHLAEQCESYGKSKSVAAKFALKVSNEFRGDEAARIPLEGLIYLRKVLAPVKPSLPFCAWGRFACKYGETAESAALLFSDLQSRRVVLPETLLRQGGESFSENATSLEYALELGDSIEEIFEGLKTIALSIKKSAALSINLARIRPAGAAAQEGSVQSRGIKPIVKMIAEACKMLSIASSNKHKPRVFLPMWHGDIQDFLNLSLEYSSELRFCVCVQDAFMKKVVAKDSWSMIADGRASEAAPLRSPKLEEKIAEKGNEGLKTLHAPELFDLLVSSIGTGRGPSVFFSDAAFVFGDALARPLPGPRMSSFAGIGSAGMSCAPPEFAVDLAELKDEEAQAVILRALNATRKAVNPKEQPFAPNAISACVLGEKDPRTAASKVLSAARALPWPEGKESNNFWHENNPFEHRMSVIRALRRGFLDIPGGGSEEPMPSGFRGACLLSGNYREEYLWITGKLPPFQLDGDARREVRYRRAVAARSSGKEKSSASIKDQCESVAKWQMFVDQCVSWDANLGILSRENISTAILTAWLKGLTTLRRFNGKLPIDHTASSH